MEEKLGWLRNFAPQIRRWEEMLAVVGVTEHYIRHEGVHRKAEEELLPLMPKPATPAARRLRKQLLEFVTSEGQQAKEDERLLGSSEVLESIIGKFKNVAGERGQHGLTGMVLSIGALVGRTAVATVQAAMSQITNHQAGGDRQCGSAAIPDSGGANLAIRVIPLPVCLLADHRLPPHSLSRPAPCPAPA